MIILIRSSITTVAVNFVELYNKHNCVTIVICLNFWYCESCPIKGEIAYYKVFSKNGLVITVSIRYEFSKLSLLLFFHYISNVNVIADGS